MKYNPHPYQSYATEQVLAKPKIALLLEMGLGKSAITLDALRQLIDRKETKRVLIIAPKSVAETVWQSEVEKWDDFRHLRVSTILGNKKQREAALNSDADLYIINRENVVWLVRTLGKKWRFDTVVIDESTSFKNWQAKRWRALRAVRARIKRMILLTGTPAPNTYIDLWAQIYLLDAGKRLGGGIGTYRDRYFLPDKRSADVIYSWKLRPGAGQQIRDAISDICISMRSEDYLTLPEMVTVDVPVKLGSTAQKVYNMLERDMLLQVDTELITAGSAATLTGKLLQLCNGAVYGSDGKYHEINDAKLKALLERVDSLRGAHVLIFYNFRSDQERLFEALSGLNMRVREYTGAQDVVDWNNGDIDILLAHPASTAYGLNLQQGGHHIIWYGLTWSLEQYQQANARLHRQGQHEPVIVHRLLIQGGADEDVARALESKTDAQNVLMDGLKARVKRYRR